MSILQTIKTIIRVVLYLRLSDEDKNKLSKEELSQSIKNQEIMLRDYAEEQGWEVVGVYNDDDWSGSDATRPDFNRMIEECKKEQLGERERYWQEYFQARSFGYSIK